VPWEQTLDVTTGHCRFVPERTSASFTLSGTLECTAPFLVRFQVVEYPAPFAVSDRGEELGVVGGTVALRAGKRTQPGYESPSSFLELCSRLLAPTERQTWYGYVFSADLDMGARGPLRCSLNNLNHMENEQILVEFAYLDDPYVLIRDGVCQPLVTPELLEGVLRDKLRREHGWGRLETG